MKKENLISLQKTIKEIDDHPISYDSVKLMLLTSIATSLAQIADVMIDNAESEDKE